ncbi:MAG: hypothetical protein ACPGVG_18870, partial [Mycobacterium sp.]
IKELYPYRIEDDEGLPFTIGRNVVNSNLYRASPAKDFRLAVHLLTAECDPNSAGQLTIVEVPMEAVGSPVGAHPSYEVFDNSETARYDHNGNLVNEQLIKARAQSVARVIAGSFQDRLTGMAGWVGLYDVYPSGPAKHSAWRLEPSGAFVTVLDMSEPYPSRDEDVVIKDPQLRLSRQRLPEAP